jgi:methylmalonyl-CoA/ethylmalonyl-CoA epimerase
MGSFHSVTGVDHIGIAVPSIEAALPLWRDALGLQFVGIEVVPQDQVRVAILKSPGVGGARIELLEPTSPDSPVARHLERRGPGIHHVALAVDDLVARMAALAAAGAPAMDAAPRAGAEGAKVTFLHPHVAGGVLVELTEPARRAPASRKPGNGQA